MRHNSRKIGGRAIDSGGYGCIFSPPIESYNCIGNTSKTSANKKYISKLMLKSDAEEEYRNSKRINDVIRRGDRSVLNYVLTDETTLCEVRKINKVDLDGFSTHCKRLNEKGFNFSQGQLSDITPDKLRKLRTINTPYGGKNLYAIFNFLRTSQSTELQLDFCIDYALKVKELYQRGIYKLYDLSPKIIHGDIKEENLICEFTDTPVISMGNIKIIDWGLSYFYDSEKSNNPDINLKSAMYQISRRPYQFNLPFIVLLYSSHFQDEYTQRVLNVLNSPRQSTKISQWQLIEQFCNSYFNNQFFYESKNGERKYILDDFNKSIFIVIKRIFPNMVMSLEDYVRKYLATALHKYTYPTSSTQSTFMFTTSQSIRQRIVFHIDALSSEVYLPMVDSYGFFLTYGSLLGYLLSNEIKTPLSYNTLSVNTPRPYLSSNSKSSSGINMMGGNNKSILLQVCKFIANSLLINCLTFDPNIKGREYRMKIFNHTNDIHNELRKLTR